MIQNVPTAVTAFVGATPAGPFESPTAVASVADADRLFGGLDRDSPLSYAVRQFFRNGGREALIVRAGPGGVMAACEALETVGHFNLLVIPDTCGMPPVDAAQTAAAAAALCERRRAFCLVDPPAALALADVPTWAASASVSPNAAAYLPAVLVPDPLDAMRPRAMAASGTIAGVYARTDAARGVWKAPAGVDATLGGVPDLAATWADADIARLTAAGINTLRRLPGRGCVIWGARTMAGGLPGDYRYVPVRRLVLFIEESLDRGTRWAVFEPNEAPLWTRLRTDATAFLQGLFRQGAFAGLSPRAAYFVRCGPDTTTEADRRQGVVNLIIGIAPLRPAEFVVLTIRQAAAV